MGGPGVHDLLKFKDRPERYDRALCPRTRGHPDQGEWRRPWPTDFNGYRGTRTPEDGAAVAIRLATLDAAGPTGAVFEDETRLAW
jgi:hypothetical protein